ncbi:aa3-type cytochrome c oxidase subunit IV [Pseudogemmobacter faecipullorum]|uniref:Aa3-type cytochrome c oxidase subunit IV n=1 Tax=Pseudogemmobacter faecipullorum TaxID=2755041 RepID=A0ABS8CHQ0_9RHOB|nr:aa3-type cytochrome c oxidase subunit IV [Pseudogemmobacter faecipullorum]MCB5408912.1 aa3-type cytochrome c oxidase subunit IV [Pseudogemmobacter faecipullorum]
MAQHDHSEHQHGSMDIREHEKTFAGFIKFANWTIVLIVLVLIFLAIART